MTMTAAGRKPGLLLQAIHSVMKEVWHYSNQASESQGIAYETFLSHFRADLQIPARGGVEW